jgi:hypothetical protein
MTLEEIKREMEIRKIIARFKTELDAKAKKEKEEITAKLIVRRRYSGILGRRSSHLPPLRGSTIA